MRSFSVTKLLAFLFVLGLAGLLCSTFVSALTYQQEIGVSFTFNPALRLTVSADLYIYNLAPGTASDSNIINVNVLTNTINGYTLTATVGNNTVYNTRNLVHSNSNINNTFTSVDYSATPTITTNTNLGSNKWAFSFSTDNGSNWSNYNGLPLYSDTTNIATLKETNGPVATTSGDDIKFKIAANASSDQASGEYNNVINFNLAAKVLPQYTVVFDANTGSGTMPNQIIFRDEATMLAPNSFTPPTGLVFDGWNTAANGSGTSYTNQQSVTNIAADGGSITLYAQWGRTDYMQDQTATTLAALMPNEGDSVTLYDKRDNKDYTVKRINGQYWMTQNLRYLGDTGSTAGTMTIGNSNSNVTNKSITLYSLDSSNAGNFGAYTNHCDSTNGYNYACVYDSGSTTTGVWYNYYAATAGTISTDSNTDPATSDICPAGWHLPTGPSTTAGTDFNILVGNTTSGYQDPTAGLTAFSAVAGGRYFNGSLDLTGYGFWWSATANVAAFRYFLGYNSSTGQFTGDYGNTRNYSYFIRCMRS